MHYLAVLQLLILLTLANGSPVVAKKLFGDFCSWPLDGNIKLIDGRALFGASKTVRGILVSLFITSVCAPLIGLTLTLGLVVATTAMAGDLLSSFLKRRLGLKPSSRAIGLDQVPESLFPLLVCGKTLSLTNFDIAAGTAIFFVGEILISRALFRLHVRDQPY